MAAIPVGQKHSESVLVGESNIASAVGSGLVDVFATPMMVALLELAASNCVKEFLDAGQVTVGAELNVSHTAPTPIGMMATATATVTAVDNRRIDYAIEVVDGAGPIGSGTHVRYIVDRTKFMLRAAEKKKSL